MATMTATQANDIIEKHIKSFEGSGDTDSALDLMCALNFTAPLARKEFMELPLAAKCKYWRKQGKAEGFIVNLCVDMLNFELGDGWRDDDAIRVAMTHPNPADLL